MRFFRQRNAVQAAQPRGQLGCARPSDHDAYCSSAFTPADLRSTCLTAHPRMMLATFGLMLHDARSMWETTTVASYPGVDVFKAAAVIVSLMPSMHCFAPARPNPHAGRDAQRRYRQRKRDRLTTSATQLEELQAQVQALTLEKVRCRHGLASGYPA